MLAIDERASIFCALLILGIISMDITDTFFFLRSSRSFLFCAGQTNEMRVVFDFNNFSSGLEGALTLTMISDLDHISFEDKTLTPASL